MKTWFEPREVLFTFGELDLGIRTLVADFEFWPQVVDFGFGTLVVYYFIKKFVQVFWKLFSLTWLSCLARDMQLT